MILILTDEHEATTDLVIDWLVYLKKDFIRISLENNILVEKIYYDEDLELNAVLKIKKENSVIKNILDIKTNSDFIRSIFSNTDYKNLSSISRNKIEICKDCEIRNMCVYNSLTIKNKNHWNMEINCCYDPYIAKWQNEDDYYAVEECGNFSKQGQFIPDKEKIEQLSRQISGDNE